MAQIEPDGLRNRKRRATAARIAASAARLAAERGLAGTTIDEIADDAQVGRATFFRYYQTKENAVAEGITGPWLNLITDAIARQPAHLDATEAIQAAFAELADELSDYRHQIRELAELTRTSTALAAWTLRTYHRYEEAIAGLAATRTRDATDGDPRPRMIAALTVAAVRISVDDWIQHGGSLPDLIHAALASITIRPGSAPPTMKRARTSS
ncbi:TetR family transcriptional regulator [Actinomadura sp. WMMA1423]|uniref:acyl-CoA-like ligand-binding transcription factor n=1 Tax=Actinomadura sp. WMMA1423 TaxID=2591108 RepID=UPI00114792F2|nr:TetR family transcriptional regulator [Actinomadura sp. WMMA1423]